MTEAKRAKPKSGEPASASAHQAPVSEAKAFWLFVGFSLAVALVVLLGLRLGLGVEIDAPTLALAAACVVLVWALRGLWGVVAALARPTVDSFILESELGKGQSSVAELREEKRRVLRAIKELEFDHAMGKLSDDDFGKIGDRYRLRAIEVIRQLDESGVNELHPLLAEHLASVGVDAATPSASEAPEERERPEASEATA